MCAERSSRNALAHACGVLVVLCTVTSSWAQLNVLLITLDDMNYNSAGVTGCNDPSFTPNIDVLASEGMRFEHAHVTTAICQPCRSTLMTGRYPHRHGAIGFNTEIAEYGNVDSNVPTLQEQLSANGYYLGVMGKENHLDPAYKFPWDEIVYGDSDLDYGRNPQLYYDRAKLFIQNAQAAGKPFYLMANSHDPHRSFMEPYICDLYCGCYDPNGMPIPGFLADLPEVRDEVGRYFCSVRRADETVGKILQALEDTGVENNTLVMFLSDHGMSNPYAKANVYLNSTKTPWIVRWPGVVTPGIVDCDHMISGIDYMPTILEATGLSQVSGMDGTSFYPLLAGGTQTGRDRVYTAFYLTWHLDFYPMRSLQGRKYGYIYNDWSNGSNVYENSESMNVGLSWPAMVAYANANPGSYIDDRVDFFSYRVKEELYDYEVDPDALNNLVDDPEYASVLEQYRQEMLATMQTSEDPLTTTYQNYLATLPQTAPPSITMHPSNQIVYGGNSTTFTISASGSSPLSYQWQKNQSDLSNGGHYSGCFTYELTVSSADSGDEANYRCVVSNAYGSATTNEATLTLTTLNITQHPTDKTVCAGSTTQFTVAAIGDGTLSYQWQKNQVNLSNGGHYSGVTTATLTITGVDIGDEANYRCLINDSTNSDYSNEATLTVKTSPLITRHPYDLLVQEGDTATLRVIAHGIGSLTYQWQKDQVNLSDGGHYSGVTTAALTVSNFDSGDEAGYRCIVTDDCGSATSDEGSLTTSTYYRINHFGDGSALEPNDYAEWTTIPGMNRLSCVDLGGAYGGTQGAQQDPESPTSAWGIELDLGLAADQALKNFSIDIMLYAANTDRSTARSQIEFMYEGEVRLAVGTSRHGSNDWDHYRPGAGWSVGQHLENGWDYLNITTSGNDYTITGKYGSRSNSVVGDLLIDSVRIIGEPGASVNDFVRWNELVINGDIYSENDPPTITQHPSNQSVYEGSTATFTVAADGTSPLSYQWQKNQVDLSGGGNYSGFTTATLTVSSADSGDEANYRCVVTNAYGSATSNEATLTTYILNISQQPTAQSVCPGSTAQFNVVATGEGTLTYQWQKNQVDIAEGGHYSGCATATLTVSSADSGDEADYRCVVTDDTYSLNSDEVALTLTDSVLITLQPSNQLIKEGETAVFSVSATGGTLTYQWQKNQTNLSNAGHYSGCTTATLTVSSADSGDEANYRCVVTGDCGTATSDEASLTTYILNISQQPTAQSVCEGSTAQFNVVATGRGTLMYQWQKNQVNLSDGGHYTGVTTATLTISNADVADQANYRCLVTDDMYSLNSDEVALTVNANTVITQQPSNQMIAEGKTAVFSISASGSGTLTYQWQKNQVDLSNGGHYSGCTTATLTVSSADSGDEANYRCVVTGDCGTATSDEASLTTYILNISQQPTAQSVCSGSAAQFNVVATGEGTLTYQWQKNQVNLSDGGHYSGVATATLTISNTDVADQANYRCVVTDDTHSLNSDEAALTVQAGPTITQQPSSQAVGEGETAVFSVTAVGSGLLTYQWQKDQVDLSNGGHYSGCTTATLTVSSVDSGDEANYRCIITDDCGSSTSNEVTLIIAICGPEDLILNGDFEGGFREEVFLWGYTGSVANDWVTYQGGNLNAICTWDEADGDGGSGYSQGIFRNFIRDDRWQGIRQTIDANVGDAITFKARVWSDITSTAFNGVKMALRVTWDGGIDRDLAAQGGVSYRPTASQWYDCGPAAGNATATSVTLFCDMIGTNGKVDAYMRWDNVVAYRAHVPPAPTVSPASDSSIYVTVNAGDNACNFDAKYAISIGKGDYTLGTHWVQSDGSIGTSEFWQTEAEWGTSEVTGLATGINYIFKVKACYSSTYPKDTFLGARSYCALGSPPACSDPMVTSAISVKTHGSAGDFGIDVLNGEIECRNFGVTKLVVGFNQDISFVAGDSSVTLSSGSVDAGGVTQSAPNEVTILMSGTTDATPLHVTFPGVIAATGDGGPCYCLEEICILQMSGDVRGDLIINTFDRLEVRNALISPISDLNFRSDVRVDGIFNVFDRLDVRNAMVKSFVGSCP